MDNTGKKILDTDQVASFMRDLRDLSFKYGIILEGCEEGGGFEPLAMPDHLLYNMEWEYLKTPPEAGGHYQFFQKSLIVDEDELPQNQEDGMEGGVFRAHRFHLN